MIAPRDLIGTARKLMSGVPSDCDCRRAASTAYYALFHHLCLQFSDIVLRPGGSTFLRAFAQAYRFIDHGLVRAKCEQAASRKLDFPSGVVRFAETFIGLQQARIDADYDPLAEFDGTAVLNMIDSAEIALAAFDAESPEAQRAFAIFVALRPKGRG